MSKTAVVGDIRDVDFAEALGERYLSYALSTIVSRSLPDVRDGLKPVHRRLLYAMRELKLDPKSGYKKCARVVGDVIGKFHPHGEVAVYDSMVRMAQDFAQRYPLVDGQGNFGNIDGDNAAAYRYTESRLTEVAEALLVGIEQDSVDFRATYDGENNEPVVLPSRFPNLLANGAGVDLAWARQRWGSERIRSWEDKILSLATEGRLVRDGDRVRLSRDSYVVSNEIFQEFVSA